jgi:aspartate kinase
MLVVMKFGGTAVESGERIRHIANLALNYQQKMGFDVILVTSAVKGMTDEILAVAESVRRGDKTIVNQFVERIKRVHLSLIDSSIFDEAKKKEAKNTVYELVELVENVLHGMLPMKEVTPKMLDYLLSFGERFSTFIVSVAIRDIGGSSEFLVGNDAGIVTDSNFGEALPLMDTTKLKVSHKLKPLLAKKIIPVITGFIGGDQYGNITTIGRGGSDYSATIIAAGSGADEVWLWSDVDGLMTADPKIVSEARVIREASFAEALEMALFGAKYMHPRALEPAIESNIPMRVRNFMKIDDDGTLVVNNPSKDSHKIVKSISSIRHTALIDVSGVGMVGAPGTAGRIFDTLAKNKVNIMMISQSPSESSISMVVKKEVLQKATSTLELSLLGRVIKKIDVKEDVAVIAVVGSGMRGIKGVAARVFGAVGNKNINVIMITQGSSELNLAFVVNDTDCVEVVRTIHCEFELNNS